MKTVKTAALFATGLGLVLAIDSTARAQDFERVVPKQPPKTTTPTIETPKNTQDQTQDQTVLVPDLKGVVFVDGPAALQANGIEAAGVSAPSLPLLQDAAFNNAIAAYLGQPLTRARLDAIAHEVRERYRASDRMFIDVSVPPQNVQNGVVQFVVTEYRLGQVTVSGNRYFSTPLILRYGDLKPSERLTLPVLRQALDGYNQNPFLTVNAVVSPGDETGVTDVSLEAKDRVPYRVYAGYDNLGVSNLGQDEWYVGVNFGNLFGTGQILSYQYTRSMEGRYSSHSLTDVVPLWGGDKLLFFGAYATQKPRIAFGFESEGHSSQASVRYVHTFQRGPRVKRNLEFGFDYKQTDNNLDFDRFRLIDTNAEVDQFPILYSLSYVDSKQQLDVSNLLVISPGHLSPNNTDDALGQLVPYGKASYIYERLSFTRVAKLSHQFSWVVRASGQMANANLPYSEQLGAGGLGSVRGYDSNTAMGSEGLMFSTELRSPAFRVHATEVQDALQLGAFWDYASLRQVDPFPDQPKNVDLASIGVNAHYNVVRYFDLEFDIAQQLRRAPFTRDKGIQATVVLTISY